MADHVLLVGPISGVVTLEDGTAVNVTPAAVDVDHLSAAQVEELSHRVSMHYYENGHPDDIEVKDDGSVVQRPFEYEAPKKFAAEVKAATQAGQKED